MSEAAAVPLVPICAVGGGATIAEAMVMMGFPEVRPPRCCPMEPAVTVGTRLAMLMGGGLLAPDPLGLPPPPVTYLPSELR